MKSANEFSKSGAGKQFPVFSNKLSGRRRRRARAYPKISLIIQFFRGTYAVGHDSGQEE
jgi:hypothetical protein